MVKLYGPMHSLGASGSFADVLTYGRNQSGPIGRFRALPEDPRTQKQLAYRSACRMISTSWQILQPGNRETWDNEPTALRLTPYHAYCQYNLQLFRQSAPLNQRPTYWLAPNKATFGIATIHYTGKRIVYHLPNLIRNDCWGIYFWRDTVTAMNLDFNHCIGLYPLTHDGNYDFHDVPPGPGTFYYRCRPIRYSEHWADLTQKLIITI